MNLEESFNELKRQLKAWNGRRRLQTALFWLPRGLLGGLLLAVLLAAIARFRPLLTNREVAFAAVGLALAGLVAALVWLFWQRFPVREQARFADRQFDLQERSGTAVEIHEGKINTTPVLAKQQLSDTLTAVAQVDTRKQFPLTINRQDWLIILLAIVLLGTAVLLPNLQEELLLKQRAIDKSIQDQISALEALSQQIQENPSLTAEQKEELLQPIEQALEGLGDGAVSQEQAMATLSESEAELRDLAAQNNDQAFREQLQRAAEPLANNPDGQALGESLQNGNLSQAAASAAALADELPSLSREEQLALAEDLLATAEGLAGTDALLAQQLAEAAEALQNGDIEAAQQALRDASGTLQQRAQEAAAAQQANQAADALNEGRQELAQAGEGQDQAGQPANPDNLLPENDGRAGPNEGQGQGPGGEQGGNQGQDGEGDGSGVSQGEGQGQQGQQGGQLGGPGEGGSHVENVFVPEFRDLSGTEGVEIELPADCAANPAECGALLNETPTEFTDETSLVPYTQVFGDYRNAANEALQDDYIPLGLKGYVRDYFSSLEP